MSIVGELCFFLGTKHLAENGYETATVWCAGLGAIGILVDVITIAASRKK